MKNPDKKRQEEETERTEKDLRIAIAIGFFVLGLLTAFMLIDSIFGIL